MIPLNVTHWASTFVLLVVEYFWEGDIDDASVSFVILQTAAETFKFT